MLRISIENEVVPHKELNYDSIASVGVSVFLGLPRVYVCSPIKFVSRSDRRFKTNIFRSIIYIDYHSIKLLIRNRNYDTKYNSIVTNETCDIFVAARDSSSSEDRYDPCVRGCCCRGYNRTSVQPGDHLAGRSYLREGHVPRGNQMVGRCASSLLEEQGL